MKRLVALLLVLLIAFSISGCKSDTLTAEYAVYMGGGVNDGEIYYTDFRSEPFQITHNFSTTMCYGKEGYILSKRTTVHGDKVFYFDDAATFQNFGGGAMYRGSLYYRSLSNRKSAPVKIDTDVLSGFELNSEGNVLTYIKFENDKFALYQYDLTNSTLINSSVSTAYPDKNSGSVTYLTESGELFLYEGGKNEKIADSVTTLKGYGEDKKAICYYSNDTLYTLKGQESTTVDTGVAFVQQVYSSGEVYYVKKSEKQLVLMDFVEDSKTNSSLRSALKTTSPSTLFYYTLYYFDGSQKSVIADNVVLSSIGAPASDEVPLICYTSFTLGETDKIMISEISSIAYAQDAVKEIITSATEKHFALKGKTYTLPHNTEDYAVSPSGDTVYYYADKTDTYNLSDVYAVSASSGQIGEPELYEKQITNKLFFTVAGNTGYYKGGALYFDKIKIADNVHSYSVNAETGGISVMQNFDEQSGLGTVCHMMDGRAEVLSNGASQHIMLKDRVVYIKNGNTLYLHVEGEEREIAKAARILLAK